MKESAALAVKRIFSELEEAAEAAAQAAVAAAIDGGAGEGPPPATPAAGAAQQQQQPEQAAQDVQQPAAGAEQHPSEAAAAAAPAQKRMGAGALSAAELAGLAITMADFEAAVPKVQPSVRREGFATTPDVTWDDVGSLGEVRQRRAAAEGRGGGAAACGRGAAVLCPPTSLPAPPSHRLPLHPSPPQMQVREELAFAITQPIAHPEVFEAMGLASATGVLLFGPPGCGKTLVAKAAAAESGANFMSIKGPELLNKCAALHCAAQGRAGVGGWLQEASAPPARPFVLPTPLPCLTPPLPRRPAPRPRRYVGESERAVRQLFSRARAAAPCVLFFDEMDALAPRRGSDINQSSERVVNQVRDWVGLGCG